MLRIILLLAVSAFSNADLVAPFTVDLIRSSTLFDTVEITTYLQNRGTSPTMTKAAPFMGVVIGLDTFTVLRSHFIPANQFLAGGNFVEYKDTLTILRGPFSIHTWADPISVFEDAIEIGNNTRAQAYNFHPQILRDTILLIDTLRITIRDTVKVTLRDTVIKKDTVKSCPPTMAKAAAAYMRPNVSTTVYNAVGQPEWTGIAPEGGFPSERLKAGLHLIVQGQNARRFRVAYK